MMKKILSLCLAALLMACNQNVKEQEAEKQNALDADTLVPKEAERDETRVRDELKAEYATYGIDVSEKIPRGLEVGSEAPNFTAVDQHGNKVELAKVLGEQPVVLIFYRGEWCPVCSRYLKSFTDSVPMIEEKGAKVIAVAPESPENVQKTIEKTGIDFTVVSDTSTHIMEDYKVKFRVTEAYQDKIREKFDTDIAKSNLSEVAELPVPATYIINQNGKVTYVHFDPDYKNRATVKEILQNL